MIRILGTDPALSLFMTHRRSSGPAHKITSAVEQPGIQMRRSAERAHMDLSWMRTTHSFVPESCAGAEFTRFRSLLALNENHLQPGKGIPAHPHRDTELVLYVMDGELEHIIEPDRRNLLLPGHSKTSAAEPEFPTPYETPRHIRRFTLWRSELTPKQRVSYQATSIGCFRPPNVKAA